MNYDCEDDSYDEIFKLKNDVKFYKKKWEDCHEKWGDALKLNYGYAIRITELTKVLSEIINCKIFAWKFDHSGSMNSTQLSERDLFLKLWAQARNVLSKQQASNGGSENKESGT